MNALCTVSWRVLLAVCLLAAIGTPRSVVAQSSPAPQTGSGTDKLGDDDLQQWWQAAQAGDVAELKRLLALGMPIDTKTPYDATALMFASGRGHVEAVKLLLSEGANPNLQDRFYSASPMSWAAMKSSLPVAMLLVEAGCRDSATALSMAVRANDAAATRALIELSKPSEAELSKLKRVLPEDASEALRVLFADVPDPSEAQPADPSTGWQPSPRELETYAGEYQLQSQQDEAETTPAARENADPSSLDLPSSTPSVTVSVSADQLLLKTDEAVPLRPLSQHRFRFGEATLEFTIEADQVTGFKLESNDLVSLYARVRIDKPASIFIPSPEDLAISSPNWPQFRGQGARGVADGQQPPVTWDVPQGKNVLWKREIPGLAHSCPVIFGDRLFVTSAVSQGEDQGLRNGLYGDVDSVEDTSPHSFELYCLDKWSGEMLWKQLACESVPQVKRHLKGTHANPTPVTNGEFVVAFFGGEGLYCYDMNGQLQWQRDFGMLDSGWFFDASYQWGFASSPIIFQDMVIVQCDVQEQSFVTALRLRDGQEVWRTDRDEIPSWSTPTVVATARGPQLVTNATNYARSYDPLTGRELWRLGKHSEIVVPTPFAAHGLIYIASGYRPIKRIFAISPEAEGDMSAAAEQGDSPYVAWNDARSGPYMVTPVCYGDYFYTCDSAGVFQCLDAQTGERIYRKRISSQSATSFVGSLVAGDGHVYVPSEEGLMIVLKAGPEFEIVAENPLGELMLSTPAISEGVMYLRGQSHLVAVQDGKAS